MPAPAPEMKADPARKAALAVLAQASTAELADGLAALADRPAHIELRPVETGLVMVRGRIGGDGAPFNLGEATVTRAAVRIDTGETGFAYVLGRDHDKARMIALCDALWQSRAFKGAIERHVLAPIRGRIERKRAERQRETAATRVDFLTLVRGED
jgi:alpha-D-ribose 1-methylphosphonate 5-triphosphate synthase subunit PhnG